MKEVTVEMKKRKSIALMDAGASVSQVAAGGQANMITLLKDIDENADMLHSCLCYSSFIKGFKQRQIDVLSSLLTYLDVKAGTIITRAGEQSSFIAFIVCGGAEIVNERLVAQRILYPGDCVGELELFVGGKRRDTIQSASDNTVVALLSYKALEEVSQRQPQLAMQLMNCFLAAAVSKAQAERIEDGVEVDVESNLEEEEIERVINSQQYNGLGELFAPLVGWEDLQVSEMRK